MECASRCGLKSPACGLWPYPGYLLHQNSLTHPLAQEPVTRSPGKRDARTPENASDGVCVAVWVQKPRVRPLALPGLLAC
jgi:hypothetical protein